MALTKAQERRFWKKRIAELEKENTELRLKLKALDEQTPWKDIKDKSKLIKRLSKATEIIKELLDAQSQLDPYRNIFKDRILKAEQFISEVEE